jgi:hypothetical protein
MVLTECTQVLTPELFEKLKDVKSSRGYTLSNAIQAGVLRPHLGVGITCGDEECYTLFKEIIYPVVQGWHKFDPETQEHKSDLDPSKVRSFSIGRKHKPLDREKHHAHVHRSDRLRRDHV